MYFIIIAALTGFPAQAANIHFTIADPSDRSHTLEVDHFDSYELNPQSPVQMLRDQKAVNLLKASPYPILFIKDFKYGGITVAQGDPISKKVAEILGLNQSKPIHLFSYLSGWSVIIHETQHAQDYEIDLFTKIENELQSTFQLTGDPNFNVAQALFEWRGYSKHILELERIELRQAYRVYEVFKENGFLHTLQTFSETFKQHPELLKSYCDYLSSLEIENRNLSRLEFAPACKVNETP